MNISYINQIDSAPRRNDCGPACVVMMMGAQFPERVTPQLDSLTREIDRMRGED